MKLSLDGIFRKSVFGYMSQWLHPRQFLLGHCVSSCPNHSIIKVLYFFEIFVKLAICAHVAGAS